MLLYPTGHTQLLWVVARLDNLALMEQVQLLQELTQQPLATPLLAAGAAVSVSEQGLPVALGEAAVALRQTAGGLEHQVKVIVAVTP